VTARPPGTRRRLPISQDYDVDLTDDEKPALVAHLRHTLEYDAFPYALRFDPRKPILAKLEPPAPQPEPLPPLKPGMTPQHKVAARPARACRSAARVRLIGWCLDAAGRSPMSNGGETGDDCGP
jgi:hypothetical protein